MKKYLAVFRSRTDALSFIEDMKSNYSYAAAIPTPKQLKLGCGTSAEFSLNGISVAKRLISKKKYPSFYAIVLIEKSAGKITSVKI